jgi:hypothetical protein
MAEANRAYQNGDTEALREILQKYEGSPASVRGTGVAADLVRILRQLKQVRDRPAQIKEEIASLGESDIAILQAKAEDVGKKERDLLAEMAANVLGRIDIARQQYESEAARMKAAR